MASRMLAFMLLAFMVPLAPASAQALTQQERDSLVKHLEETRQSFVTSVSGLTDAQWNYKPGPDRWSIAEVAEHIAVSETTIRQLVTDQVMKGPVAAKTPIPVTDEALLAGLLDRTSKFQAPEMLKPTHRWATRDALLKDFQEARDKTVAYVKSTADDLDGKCVV